MSEIDWAEYSKGYNYLMAHNQPYQEIGTKLLETIGKMDLDGGKQIADLGGGTGNFAIQAAQANPDLQFVLVESNSGMTDFAKEKMKQLGISNLSIEHADMLDYLKNTEDSLAGVIAIHALYATTLNGDMNYPNEVLKEAHAKLENGGFGFIMDIGRPIELDTWQDRIYRDVQRVFGDDYFKAFKEAPELAVVRAANEFIYQAQVAGQTWNHDLSQLENSVRRAGFNIIESSDRFYNARPEKQDRGIDDFVLATK